MKKATETIFRFNKIAIMILFMMTTQIAKANTHASTTPPTIKAQPTAISLSASGEAVTISFATQKSGCEISYQWYQSASNDNAAGSAISGATSAEYTTEPFTKEEIRYYYCIATADDGTSATSKVAVVAHTGLPVVYISTGDVPTSAIDKITYVPAEFSMIMPDGTKTDYSLTNKGIKGRGNSSWGLPKKGYNLNFDDKISFFGLPKSKKWCLMANYSDKTLLRNKYASELGLQLYNSQWNPASKSVDLIMNGVYIGNYTFEEKILLGSGRVDYQDISDFTEKKVLKGTYTDQNGDGQIDLYDGGFVLEVDTRLDAAIYFTSTNGVKVTLKDPDEVDEVAQEHIQSVFQTAEDVLYSSDFTGADGWRNYIDEDAAIDWYIVNEFTKNNDAAFYSSVYIRYNPSDGKFYLGPNWDFDLSCGNVYVNNCDNPEGFLIKNSKWIRQMFQDPDFVKHLIARWNNNKTALFNTLLDYGLIQTSADANATSAELNFIKWPILGIYVWANVAGYEDRTTYQSEIDYMRNWLSERYVWLDYALNALDTTQANTEDTVETAELAEAKSDLAYGINSAKDLYNQIKDNNPELANQLQQAITAAETAFSNPTLNSQDVKDAIDALNAVYADVEHEVELDRIIVTIPAKSFMTRIDAAARQIETPVAGVSLYSVNNVSESEVELTNALNVVAAEMPYLLYNDNDEDVNVSIVVSEEETDDVQYDSEHFKGTLVDKTFTAGEMQGIDHYVLLNSNSFVWVKDAGTIAANKCWIELPASTSNVRALSLVFSGEKTGISTINGLNRMEGKCYDLSGRRIVQPTKGLIFVDGKKVMVK